MDAPLWAPAPARVASTRLWAFMAALGQSEGQDFQTYSQLWQWSINHPETFWYRFREYAGIIAETWGERVLEHGERMPGARWFPDARLNFAENLLRWRDDRPAIIFHTENGRHAQLSHRQLYQQVAALACALRAQGVRPGDICAGFMPNMPDTIIAMLATTAIGATWTACSPDFGVAAVVDRFGQVGPRVLFTSDGYIHKGKRLNTLDKAAGIVARIDSIEQVVVCPLLEQHPDLTALPGARLIADYRASLHSAIDFPQLPFDHPLYVLYSSGTTGAPKCIVHGAGGTLIQHLKELILHTDIGHDDRLFYYTTCSWMMWHWMVSGLATGCTLILFDGSPFHPQADVLWQMAERERITVFGTSARYLAAQEKAGVRPGQQHDLSALRAVLSTGSPLAHESFDYVYREIKADLQLSSISGGTDIISCFALGCPILPVWRGELQCRGLGMAVDVFDDQGHPCAGRRGSWSAPVPFPACRSASGTIPKGNALMTPISVVLPTSGPTATMLR